MKIDFGATAEDYSRYRAGFPDILFYSHQAWRGRIRASAGVGASLSAERIAQFDREPAKMLRERFPEDPLAVPHRLFAPVCTSP